MEHPFKRPKCGKGEGRVEEYVPEDLFKVALACETTHESFDVVVSKVWLHSRHVKRSYHIYKSEQLALRIRCTDIKCAFRVNTKRDAFRRGSGVRITLSCLEHCCDGTLLRVRGPKSSLCLVAARTILPLMLAAYACESSKNDDDDVSERMRAAESLMSCMDLSDVLDTEISVDDEASMDRLLQSLLHSWRSNLASGGTNNSVRLGGIKRIAAAQDQVRALDKDAVVVDVGSGAGFACCFYALRYGCKVYGIEKSQRLVEIAKHYTQKADVSDLCVFHAMSFKELSPTWLEERKVTHILAFDGIFAPDDWNYLFHNVLSKVSASVVGASVSKFSTYWPSNFTKCGDTIPSIGLSGSKSTFSFAIWTTTTFNKPT